MVAKDWCDELVKQSEVLKLIAGPGIYICNECVGICDQILKDDEGKNSGGGIA